MIGAAIVPAQSGTTGDPLGCEVPEAPVQRPLQARRGEVRVYGLRDIQGLLEKRGVKCHPASCTRRSRAGEGVMRARPEAPAVWCCARGGWPDGRLFTPKPPSPDSGEGRPEPPKYLACAGAEAPGVTARAGACSRKHLAESPRSAAASASRDTRSYLSSATAAWASCIARDIHARPIVAEKNPAGAHGQPGQRFTARQAMRAALWHRPVSDRRRGWPASHWSIARRSLEKAGRPSLPPGRPRRLVEPGGGRCRRLTRKIIHRPEAGNVLLSGKHARSRTSVWPKVDEAGKDGTGTGWGLRLRRRASGGAEDIGPSASIYAGGCCETMTAALCGGHTMLRCCRCGVPAVPPWVLNPGVPRVCERLQGAWKAAATAASTAGLADATSPAATAVDSGVATARAPCAALDRSHYDVQFAAWEHAPGV